MRVIRACQFRYKPDLAKLKFLPTMSFARLEKFVKETGSSARIKNRLKLVQRKVLKPQFTHIKTEKGMEIIELSYQLLQGGRQNLERKATDSNIFDIKSTCWFKPNGLFYLLDFPWRPLVQGVLDLISFSMFDDIGFTLPVTLSRNVFQRIEDWVTGSEHPYPGSVIRYIFREILIENRNVEELNIRALSPPPGLLNTLKEHSQSWEVLTLRTPGIRTKTKTIRIEKTGKLTVYSRNLETKAFFSFLDKLEELIQGMDDNFPS
ncbi:MAG: hypothetical protein ACFFCZ_19175 [Promethearchaeota archaeon]